MRSPDYPRAYARTARFTLGAPRTFTVSPDGARVLFLRSPAGDDPTNALWAFDVARGEERLLLDPRGEGGSEAPTQAERDRRERVGERAGGITAYSTDAEVRRAVVALGRRLLLIDVLTGEVVDLMSSVAVDDPRLDPTGTQIAYVADRALHVLDLERADRVLAQEDDPDVSWGLAEFVAAEEMRRFRGHWWSPDGERLAATRVDVSPVRTWWISEPSDPERPPRPIRYPAAGTDDAIVTLHVFNVRTGEHTNVAWDRDTFPYLARVDWSEGSPLTLLVVARDQRRAQVLEVDADEIHATVAREVSDREWVDVREDGPERLEDGRLVMIRADRETDTYRLVVGDVDVTPPGLQVRSLLDAGDGVLFTASEADPAQVDLWRWRPDEGAVRIAGQPGVHAGTGADAVTVHLWARADEPVTEIVVLRDGSPAGRIGSNAERPPVEASPRFLALGEHGLASALLLPGGRDPDGPLPVLLDPYGGPHSARVLSSRQSHLTSQWLADELGAAVLVVDGRGTPGRGPAWERAMHRDFTIALEDQVDALEAAAARLDFLDRSRVAIRGWSFGGYLAAMAVLRRPDVFHAAIAGAPVTDWRLYDTYYTERYLGTPQAEPEAYRRNSLLDDAAKLERPLLLIHGLVDDNVVAAHTLRLSAALFEHGRRHEVVILPDGTHRQVNEEGLLNVQVEFLRRALGLGEASSPA